MISLFAPLYLPPLAALIGGSTAHIDAVAMLGRIVAVIGAAAGAAVLLRRFAGAFVARNPLRGLPSVEAYLAASVIPIFMLPSLTKLLIARWPVPPAPEVTSLQSRVPAP